MKRSYEKDLQVTSDGSAVLTVADKQVKPGQILIVRSLAANHDNIATTEGALLYMTNGGQTVNIHHGVPSITGGLVSWQGEIAVPEGWWLVAAFAAAANTEVMRLDIIGELLYFEQYRTGE